MTYELAENGKEAVEMALASQYDLILMDCFMPIMDGYQATQTIKESLDIESTPPILALTANALKSDIEKCQQAGMDDHIAKPIDPEDLENKLEKWLG